MSAVICGGVTERQLGEALITIMDIPVLNMVGETSLSELVSVIKEAQFLLGNETSAVHIASAVATPAFCLLGGGHYGRFMPYDIESKTKKSLPVAIIHQMDKWIVLTVIGVADILLKKATRFPVSKKFQLRKYLLHSNH